MHAVLYAPGYVRQPRAAEFRNARRGFGETLFRLSHLHLDCLRSLLTPRTCAKGPGARFIGSRFRCGGLLIRDSRRRHEQNSHRDHYSLPA
jgi:hypothetical protein